MRRIWEYLRCVWGCGDPISAPSESMVAVTEAQGILKRQGERLQTAVDQGIPVEVDEDTIRLFQKYGVRLRIEGRQERIDRIEGERIDEANRIERESK